MSGTLLHRFLDRALAQRDDVAFAVLPRGATALAPAITWGAWYDASRAVALALLAHDLPVGGTVLIFADNRPLWPIVDLAVLMVRGVSVGAYPTSAATQLAAQLRDCGARFVFVDTAERLQLVRSAQSQVPWPLHVVVDDAVPTASPSSLQVTAFADFAMIREPRGKAPLLAELAQRLLAITPADAAMLIYTSGSTGEPKGARITHRYLSASAESIASVLGLSAADSGIAFLPFCHAAERVFGLYTRIFCGMSAVLVEAPDDVWRGARLFEPTVFGGLPRLFEKLHAATRDADSPEAARAILASRVGSRLRRVTSGGAALPVQVARELEQLGVTVLGAYGQTEHLCLAMNRPDAYRHDAVGLPMPGTEVRVDHDGELLVRRGALTFSGYHGRVDASRDAFTDDGAWLRTGDLAVLEPDGMLRITGRRKELIALSTGKKVAPVPIEQALMACPLVAVAVCHGEGERFLSAALLLDQREVERFAAAHHVHVRWPDVAQHSEVRTALQAHVDSVNADRSRPEQVRAFVVSDASISAIPEALTPTLKVKREVVSAHLRASLDALYAAPASEHHA